MPHPPAIPEIETNRLRLRAHRLDDFQHCAAMWANPEVTRYIGGTPLSAEDAWSKFLRYGGHWAMMGFGFWAVEEKATGLWIGEVGMADFKRDVQPPLACAPEAGWVLASAAHGKGFATEAVMAALTWGEQNITSAETVCLIHPENAASIRVASKCGFEEPRPAFYKGHPTTVFTRRNRKMKP